MSDVIDPKAPAAVEVKGGVVPYLSLDGAVKAAAFYEKAFGATIAAQYPPDENGRTMHVHLYINGGSLMLSDGYPEHGAPALPPQGYTLMLPVTDIETWFKRAVDAGAEAKMKPEKMFWGDVYGEVRDPFGVTWAMNQQA
ncbi:MAG: glyoxalase/bleomycin resistance/extradiol dioxygenase family protein [Phenylobacterium sp.]|uniref:VOC family protein n=1 Tax=Phenylobacterium sp. TaxID=1871053 RepID=UPI002734C89D|nr:glyoxalase/bleomycin resistance/extradiol dioxygenase family protein [Phenylobacterium sp.]MDP3748531.1 glyoxalase/bleomycin resistance/extradiol dioxygenase family protein [Phenylobacterium sp.]